MVTEPTGEPSRASRAQALGDVFMAEVGREPTKVVDVLTALTYLCWKVGRTWPNVRDVFAERVNKAILGDQEFGGE